MRRLLFILLALPAMAIAAPPYGMQEVGKASLKKMFLHVYDATLYAPGGVYSADKKHALELTYQMDFTSDEIVDRSMDEIKHAQKVSAEQQTKWRQELSKVIPDVKEGDTIRAVATPNKAIMFSHNGKATGNVTDPSLVAPFMNIWLGEKTTEPALRSKLIAAK